ncbi:MAG TPA: hypothetical protein VG225_11300 [Terracidiphilus sp.]|jgi:hypothetical protein|nr:hypothetical protein [Terracidiphilus sp.]
MRIPHEGLWQLSFPELAGICQEIGHSTSPEIDPALREEARLLYGGWTDALSINKHEEGAAERQAGMTAALRKRTIELVFKTSPAAE